MRTSSLASRSVWVGSLQALLTALVLCAGPAYADALEYVERKVARDYDLPQVSVGELQAEMQERAQDWLILDVREPDEFAVSHLPGAVQVDPETTPDEFAQRFGNQLDGRMVLFYCSVGRRSSALAARVESAAMAGGAKGVANLQGGIFRWHGDRGALVNDAGAVDRIHHYNWVWGQLAPRENPPDQH